MVKIVQKLVSINKYNIKCPYAMIPQGITVHNTANDASAINEINYMISNNNEVSFHYAVDDKEAVQGLPLNRNGWHASDGGNGFGNRKTIAIEICYSKSGGARFDKAEENAAELIAMLLQEYGWGIDKVKRHYDYARDKKYCPHRTMDKGWDRFLNMVKSKMSGSETVKPSNVVNVYYQVETKEDGVLPMVKNLEDYAGWKNHTIRYLAIKADKGSVKYRVTTVNGKTLPWITKCDIKDHKNGCAGNGEPIATVEAYYYTPESIIKESGYKYIYYKINDYPYQKDTIKGQGFDGYAGVKGVTATKFQAYIDN